MVWIIHSKLETVETALHLKITSGKGFVLPELFEGCSLIGSKGVSPNLLFKTFPFGNPTYDFVSTLFFANNLIC